MKLTFITVESESLRKFRPSEQYSTQMIHWLSLYGAVPSRLRYKLVSAFKLENEIQKFDHSNESYLAVLSCGTVLFIVLYKVVLACKFVAKSA